MAKTPSKTSKAKPAAKTTAAKPKPASAGSKPASAGSKPASAGSKTAPVPATSKAKTSLRSKTKAVTTRPTAARKTATRPKLVPVDTGQEPRKELVKRDLIERIAAESGMKKGEVRTALDATLVVLRQALREGVDISAAPLGKLKIAREKETANGKLVVCRIKLKEPGNKSTKGPLAKPAE